MKQSIRVFSTFTLMMYIIFLLGGCSLNFIFGEEPTPYGIWQSKHPDITLYIDPAVDKIDYLYPGVYVLEDGESSEVFLRLDMSKSGMANIHPLTALQPDGSILADFEYVFFNGHMHEKDGKLFFYLKPAWQEETGYKEIVFEKIGDYPLPEDSAAQ